MAHFIRLRGPWNVERSRSPAGRDAVKFIRQFGNSAGLRSASRVWLAIEDIAGSAAVELNGSALGRIISSRATDEAGSQHCPARFEITNLLQPRNLLVIEFRSLDGTTDVEAPGEPGLVRLEID
jgi:hypothetical protein